MFASCVPTPATVKRDAGLSTCCASPSVRPTRTSPTPLHLLELSAGSLRSAGHVTGDDLDGSAFWIAKCMDVIPSALRQPRTEPHRESPIGRTTLSYSRRRAA